MTPAQIMQDGRETLAEHSLPKGWTVHEASKELQTASTTLENYQLIGSLVYANEVHVLGGDDRAGKSKFAISMLASILRRKELIPGFHLEATSPIVCGLLDFELTAKTAEKRHGKLLKEYADKNLFYTIRPIASELAAVTDRVDEILKAIESIVNAKNLNVLLWDNVLAWLGDDVSDNKIYMKLYYGLKAIIERRNKEGHFLSFILVMHITKSAQDRREELGAAATSRRSDIRGAGAMQSTSASVMEIRQSGMDEDQAILIHFNTRHAKGENLAKHGKGYAFNVTHEPGDWAHEFLNVVELEYHFGKNLSSAPADVQRAANTDDSLVKAILNLNARGMNNSEIKRKIESVHGKHTISRQRIIDVLKCNARKSPLSKQLRL